jgi:aminomethyltransferase
MIAEKLLCTSNNLKLAGLAVRNTLRIEAGFNLYGQEITEAISPIEASMTWTIGKRYLAEQKTPASIILARLLANKPASRPSFLIGFRYEGPPAHGGEVVYREDGMQIGNVTSGTFSPSLNCTIAIVRKQISKGTLLQHDSGIPFVQIRNKMYPGVWRKLPFVPHQFTQQ